ncbi:uncharacterized protein LOC105167531 isoform X15 [Sesamum indicum]|uniref:Uncharacterized protein LOC105167531 isoform X15 n=1 Tax=Sesamum indicum TaxID=4182 RepID=A0A8M8V6J2_SESIN|nr:uncharacterized protein LOC105167531 isoform X15 [Sesamum indicum]
MGKRKSPDKAAGREKEWDRVFNALVTLSQNLQKDRRFLEERRKSLHQVIYKMKKEQKVESAKAELMLGLKDREAFTYKQRYGKARILSLVEGVKHQKKNQILCRPLRRWLIESEVLVSQLKERPLGSNSIERKRSARKSSEGKAPRQQFNLQMAHRKRSARKSTEGKAPRQQFNRKMAHRKRSARKSSEGKAPRQQFNRKMAHRKRSARKSSEGKAPRQQFNRKMAHRKRSARKSSEGKAPRQQFNLKMAHGKRSARKSSEWKARRLQFNLKRFVEQLCELSRSSAAFLSQNATLKADRTMEGANMDRSIEVISRIGDKLKSTESHDIVS